MFALLLAAMHRAGSIGAPPVRRGDAGSGTRFASGAGRGLLHSALMHLAIEAGDLARAWGAKRMADVPWRLRAAAAHTGLGEPERAAALVDDELRAATAFGVPRHVALALRAAAYRAGGTDAQHLVQQAVDLLDGGPGRLELARALEHLGGVLLRAGDRNASRRAFRRAADLAYRCHADALAERLRARLAAGADGHRGCPCRASTP